MNRACATGLVLLTGLFSGCQSVPRASFNSYLQGFNTVKATADDIYLRSGNIAEDIASRPETEGTIAERLNQLDTRRSALNSRLAAIALIDRYNQVLVRLASGQTADAVKSDITGLQQDLSSLDVRSITASVAKATPFVGIVSQGIALIEDAVKKKHFAEAVAAAQKPVGDILDILLLDADDLQEVIVQDIQRGQDPYFKQIASYGSLLNKRLKGMKTTPESDALLVRMNKTRQSIGDDSMTPLSPKPEESAVDSTPAGIDALTAIVGQAELAAASYSKLAGQITAEKRLFQEYKAALNSTKTMFAALQDVLNAGRYSATADFIKQAQALRKATLRLREAQ